MANRPHQEVSRSFSCLRGRSRLAHTLALPGQKRSIPGELSCCARAGFDGPFDFRKLLHAGTGTPSVYPVSARVAGQEIWRPGVPRATITLPELRSEAYRRGQSGLARAAPSGPAVAGSMIAGAGLIAAVLVADLALGAFLRGVSLSSAFLARTAIEEAGLIAGVLAGAFLAHE